MANDMRNEDVLVVGILMAHPQPNFVANDHPYVFGEEPHTLAKKQSIPNAVAIDFMASDIGQYEMPVIFTFFKPSEERSLIFMREMVVYVQENPLSYIPTRSPYNSEHWAKPDHFIRSTNVIQQQMFKVPKLLKILFPRGLNEDSLEGLHLPREELNQLRVVLIDTRAILEEGITKENYMIYFHHLLWWEEVIERINLRKYNMTMVKLEKVGDLYMLEVPGLAEKRPSLLRGDRVVIRPVENTTVHFESYIKSLEDCKIHLAGFDDNFHSHFSPDADFDVRFLMSRVPLERMHEAVSKLHSSKQVCRVFPVPNNKPVKLKTIDRFYNKLIKDNSEQRSAVQHIVSGTAGKAPYIVFGPPGTGKTMTIVEAIIQIVVSNPRNRVMVCTDSNMAADHIAVMLLHYNKTLNITNYLLRANSQSREWSVMPPVLAPVSNGTSYENFYSVSNVQMASYRIVITTLSHAAKYASPRNQTSHKVQMTHLFIDEAAQASEPATLVPICGLLAPSGKLVLAGDPQQLGPVCISREAQHRGLGTSLLERLHRTYKNLYSNDNNYITMLIKNFRSDPDILAIPNRLFYNDNLVAQAERDALSALGVLGGARGRRALLFHAVHSVEQRMGNAPSYFNERELDMVKRYIKALVTQHQVLPEDIGVIAPYIRQVYKVKGWLTNENYEKIEVGTVESFQGKEKRVIIVTTVRANCKLLDYDAKYSLGFLVDDKRFNVTLTRAKAKLIIIGNPACLVRDRKWREYMDLCREYDCYFGEESQQLERTAALHLEVKSRLNKARILETLNMMKEEKNKKDKKNKKKNIV
ncbi:putative helicase mov-10-B.1 isoform X2 [Plodia interpunctella]|nr:putative helicase mov-10-B.1 isoform X2 [Plodia interpunctella]